MLKLPSTACRAGIAAALMFTGLLVCDAPSDAAEPRPSQRDAPSDRQHDTRANAQVDRQLDGHAGHKALAQQPELVERALAELQPSGDGKGHLYFVGFAGYGLAGVFKREVEAVRDLFNERFGTRGRSVALINHQSTVGDVPLASAQNLDRVLRHLGRIMDRNRDTLFLFLTSHGVRALLAVEMPGIPLEPLSPRMLKTMLDRSGIRNSVIVVSACHSGSFIPALASPTRTRDRGSAGRSLVLWL